jgi:nucleoporin NUP82
VDDEDEGKGETERLGVVLIAYQDGRVDVCLDVEKVEARWQTKSVSDEWTR